MKMQTMLLPTGEFVFVISKLRNRPDAEALNGYSEFRKSAGAVGLLVTDNDVEIVDAYVEENAMAARMDSYGEVDELVNGPTESETTNVYHFPRMSFGDTQVSTTFQLGDQDSQLFDLLAGGAEVGPMGTVKGGPRGPENDVANDPEFMYGTPDVEQEGEAVVADPTWDVEPISEDEPGLEYEPKVGDHVRMLAINSEMPDNPYVGATGVLSEIMPVGTSWTNRDKKIYVVKNPAWKTDPPAGTTQRNDNGTAWAIEVEPVVPEARSYAESVGAPWDTTNPDELDAHFIRSNN